MVSTRWMDGTENTETSNSFSCWWLFVSNLHPIDTSPTPSWTAGFLAGLNTLESVDKSALSSSCFALVLQFLKSRKIQATGHFSLKLSLRFRMWSSATVGGISWPGTIWPWKSGISTWKAAPSRLTRYRPPPPMGVLHTSFVGFQVSLCLQRLVTTQKNQNGTACGGHWV